MFKSEAVAHQDLNTRHARLTDLGRLVVTGDGRTWGQGLFEANGTAPATATPSPTVQPAPSHTPAAAPSPTPTGMAAIGGRIFLDSGSRTTGTTPSP